VRGAEGWGRRLQTFSNSFTLMQGVPELHNTAAGNIRSDYVGLHRPAGRVSACCMRQVLGSPEYHLGDGLVQLQVRLPVFPRIPPYPCHPPRSVERTASSCRHQPAAICAPLQNGNRERGVVKVGWATRKQLTSGFAKSKSPSQSWMTLHTGHTVST
jgi:hypothetical protein